MASFKDLATNDVPARTVYPTAGGGSLGARSTAYSPYTVGDAAGGSAAVLAPGMTATSAENAAGADNATARSARPAVVVVGVPHRASVRRPIHRRQAGERRGIQEPESVGVQHRHRDADGDYRYRILKVLFNRFKVPGLTAFVNAV
jgi:hypothetical protein